MRMRTLGRSGLVVSELSLGTMIFGEDTERATPPEEASAMIARFLDAGGNFVDTASGYAGGRSEEIVGAALEGIRDDVVIATKAHNRTGPGPNAFGTSRRHLIESVATSLRRLRTDYLDLVYLHLWDPVTPLEETMAALDDLVRAGMARYAGISNFSGWQAMKSVGLAGGAGRARPVAAQYQYSLLSREIEHEIVPLVLSEGLGLVPWGPLGGGFLSGKYRADARPREARAGRVATTPDVAEESWARRGNERTWRIVAEAGGVADELDVGTGEVAIAWLLHKPFVSSVIFGARTMAQLDQNLRAAGLDLSPDALERLDEVSAEPEPYPYRMQRTYGSRDDVARVPGPLT